MIKLVFAIVFAVLLTGCATEGDGLAPPQTVTRTSTETNTYIQPGPMRGPAIVTNVNTATETLVGSDAGIMTPDVGQNDTIVQPDIQTEPDIKPADTTFQPEIQVAPDVRTETATTTATSSSTVTATGTATNTVTNSNTGTYTQTSTEIRTYVMTAISAGSKTSTYTATETNISFVDLCQPTSGDYATVWSSGLTAYPGSTFFTYDHSNGQCNDISGPNWPKNETCTDYVKANPNSGPAMCFYGSQCGYCKIYCGYCKN